MNILGFNISVSRNHKSKIINPKSFAPEAWLSGEDFHGSSVTLSNAYEQSAWVYRAVNAIAEQVANVPFLFSRGERGRENLITSGPLHDFYNRPSSTIDRFQYWELRILWLLLRGECFRVPIFGESSSSSPALSSSSSSSTSSSPAHDPIARAIN